MKISSKTDYALRTIMYLAMNREKGVITIAEIAKEENIPIKFLEQILLALKLGGVVVSKRGARGGYSMVKDPSDISLYEILKITEDSILLPKREVKWADFSKDPYEGLWDDLNQYVNSTLKKSKLSGILKIAATLSEGRSKDFSI